MKLSKLMLGLIILLPILVCLGCGDDDDGITKSDPIPANLVGTWWFNSATENGDPITYTELNYSDSGVTQSVTFTANGDWNLVEYDSDMDTVYTGSGTFSVSGNQLTITVKAENGQPVTPPQTSTSTYAVSGDILTITVEFTIGSESYTIVVYYDKE